MALKVAVTGPTGEIGKPLLEELERRSEVGSVLGMARRPFDPAEEGGEEVNYRGGGGRRSATGGGTSSIGGRWRRCSTGLTWLCTLPLRSSAAGRRRGGSTC